MTGVELVDWVIGILVAAAGLFGTVAAGMKMLSESRSLKAEPKTPYETLNARVQKLEESDEAKSQDIFKLRSQLYRFAGVLSREVYTLVSWHEKGHKPPAPEEEIRIIKEVIDEIHQDNKATH